MTEQKIDVLVEAVRKVVSDLEQRNAELEAKLIEERDIWARTADHRDNLQIECDRLRSELANATGMDNKKCLMCGAGLGAIEYEGKLYAAPPHIQKIYDALRRELNNCKGVMR